jgi:hypothetical protein
MSGRIAKSQIPLRRRTNLPPEAAFALITAKTLLKAGGALTAFRNRRGNSTLEGPPLPLPSQGCVYYEVQVGQAHPLDTQGLAGSKRLVLEVNVGSRQVREVYYTEEHYEKFSFVRVV